MSDRPFKKADRTPNRSAVLVQFDNPRYVPAEMVEEVEKQNRLRLRAQQEGRIAAPAPLISVDRDPYVYRVETLRNLMEPAVGEVIRKEQVQLMIEDGVEVNIKPAK